jgi:hypothetical protein
MFIVSGRISTNTGTAPLRTKASAVDTKVYDGTPLVNDGYELDGELGINNYLELEIKGSQTNIGKSENTVSSIKIVNALNKDVTDNYKITYTNGVLFVTPNLG